MEGENFMIQSVLQPVKLGSVSSTKFRGDGLGHYAAAAAYTGINWFGSSNAMPNLYGLLHLLLCNLVPNCANRHKVIKLGWLRIFAGAAIGQLVIVSSINIPTSPNKIIFRSLVYFLHGIHCCYALRHLCLTP